MGLAVDQLTEMQRLFVAEYAISMDRYDALVKAGYKGNKNVLAARGSKLLSDPKIQAALNEIGTRLDAAYLTVDNLATQLARAIYRDVTTYLDAEGYLNCSIGDLPVDIRQTIEGFDVENEYDFETGELKEQRVKLRFIPKIKAIELAMKWRKMLQPDNQINLQANVNFDLSKLYEEPPKVNPVEQRIKENLDGS
jgi:phage terminase small subunit